MPRRPITVMIVDDDEKVRILARHIFDQDHLIKIIAEADNGQAAAALAREFCPDVILMDVSMPVMNGLQAARAILRECPEIRIIMTSALGSEAYRRASLSMGASSFLDKADLGARLVDTVHTLGYAGEQPQHH
jgi:DNA-binding NarL/FixJ family response regulator